MQVIFLGVYSTAVLANTYFFIKEFTMEFLNQYISVYLGLLASAILYATLLWKQPIVKKFEENCRPIIFQPVDVKEETKERIKKESQYITSFVKFHIIYVLISGCIVIPVGRERKFQFGITFFQDYCHSYVLEALYLLGYPITAYMFVRLAYALLYFVSHVKFQIYIILDIIEQISEGYDDKSDGELLDSEEYQKVVKARLAFLITKVTSLARLCYFGRVGDLAAAMLAGHLIPPIVISGLLMGLSVLSFIYLGNLLGYWCYFQNFLWCVGSASTLIMYTHCGQEFENNTENLFDAIYNVRWTSFNKSNRKIILIAMTIFQEPKRLRFTETTSCNYELGVRLVKTVYSFAAIMARVRDSQTIR
ncbi:hypothetical protein Zmor_011567 [Zophobas morio]|uniref:Odorant receptor n=1 Tax=Zophobas morio TaxID=2755281 RepID=A0AA38IQC0_9CUCU|nr:hypothetical protein Zmor_011567 [Zophobas morio]